MCLNDYSRNLVFGFGQNSMWRVKLLQDKYTLPVAYVQLKLTTHPLLLATVLHMQATCTSTVP